MQDQIKGKVVVITGASSGIGQAIAKMVASAGALVVLGARRKDRLEAIADEIKAAGGQAEYLVMDVAKKEDLESLDPGNPDAACDRIIIASTFS